MLICPSFFDGRLDGIGRVSGAFADAWTQRFGNAPVVWSANEANSAAAAPHRAFGRRYRRMLLAAACGRLPTLPAGAPVVCLHAGLAPVARLLARRSRRPYLVFLHGIEVWKPQRARSRWGLSGARRLLANSEFTMRRFRSFNPWANRFPATVVPLGVGWEMAAIPPASRTEAKFRVLCVGRMDARELRADARSPVDLYKGFTDLMAAVASLARTGIPAALDLVGDGDARPLLESWVAAQAPGVEICFHGRVADARMDTLFAEASAFALPSEEEGFGLVFVEAMARGLPCVCVNAGAAPEVVRDDDSGLVARARDLADLVDKLQVLATNPRVSTRIGAAARTHCRENFSRDRWIGRIAEALSTP